MKVSNITKDKTQTQKTKIQNERGKNNKTQVESVQLGKTLDLNF